jgi:hypothetical protein
MAGSRAGFLTAALSTPIRFAIDLTALLQMHQFVLTSPYDIAAFHRSGLPDAASYLLSDALGGEILGGLILFPPVLLVLAVAGAAAGGALRRRPPELTAEPIT